jgi:hypothetical protein
MQIPEGHLGLITQAAAIIRCTLLGVRVGV